MRIIIVENRIGINQELNGYIIYCSNKLKTCDSWWSSPGDYLGDIDYLQKRGYHNIETNEDRRLFTQLTTLELDIIKKLDKRYYIETRDKNVKNKYFLHMSHRVIRTDDKNRLYRFTASDVKEYIDRGFINMKYYNIKEWEV